MSNAPTLVIDGSGSHVFAGLLDAEDQWLAKTHSDCAPLEGLFPAVETTLQQAGAHFSDLGAYYYCEGPGSVLGLRLCAMAIETWKRLYPQPVHLYAFNSLQLCAQALLHDSPDLKEALIVSDWKKGAWNSVRIREGLPGPVEVLDDAALAAWSGALFHLPQRKGWQSPPARAQTVNYAPERIADLRHNPELLKEEESVRLYNSGINTFQKWTADRHRA